MARTSHRLYKTWRQCKIRAMSEQKLADGVWHRVVQIVQEAMLTGVDCADLLRQVRVQADEGDPSTLVLSPSYQKQVKEMHAKLEAEAVALQAKSKPGLIIGGSGESN